MKVTNEQVLQLLQLEMGDVIKSNDLKNYCDGIEFWKVSKGFLDEAFRLYPLYNKNEAKSYFGVNGISLNLLIGLEFEKVNNVSRVRFIKDMEYGECYKLFYLEDKLQELKPFFILCDNLIDAKVQCGTTMQDALNMLCEKLLPTSTSNLFTQVIEQLINKPYYNDNGNNDESNSNSK